MKRNCLVVLAILLLAGSHADARKQNDKELARKNYKAGKQAYAAGEFKKAAELFTAGYEHDPKPAFLINVAQAYRKAGELEQAVRYYREYLQKAPDSRLSEQVQGLIKEIEQEIEERDRQKQPPPPPQPAAVAIAQPPPPPPPPPKSKPFYKQWWFWTGVGAVVVAGVGVGIYAGTRGPDYVESGGLGSVSW